jgi:hypothetical protein
MPWKSHQDAAMPAIANENNTTSPEIHCFFGAKYIPKSPSA